MSYSDLIIDDGAFAYWRLDETAGTTANDEMGNHNGTYINSPTLGQPPAIQDGTSVDFVRASANRIQVPYHANLQLTTVMTLEVWVKRNAFSQGYTFGEGIINSGIGGYNFRFTPNGSPQLERHGVGNIVLANSQLNDTNWHHIVVTRNGSYTTAKIYIDGVEVAVTRADRTPVAPTADIAIASTNDSSTGWSPAHALDGHVDEVAIYDYALTAAQVEYHYDVGVGNEVYDLSPVVEPPTATLSFTSYDAVISYDGNATIDADAGLIAFTTHDVTITSQADPIPLRFDEMVSNSGFGKSDTSLSFPDHLNNDGAGQPATAHLRSQHNEWGSKTATATFRFHVDNPPTMPVGPGTYTFQWSVGITGDAGWSYNHLKLISGTTTIREISGYQLHEGYASASTTLTQAQVDAIDWNDLKVEFSGWHPISNVSVSGELHWYTATLRVPPRIPISVEEYPPTAELSFASTAPTVFADGDVVIEDIQPAAISFSTFDIDAPGEVVRLPLIARPIESYPTTMPEGAFWYRHRKGGVSTPSPHDSLDERDTSSYLYSDYTELGGTPVERNNTFKLTNLPDPLLDHLPYILRFHSSPTKFEYYDGGYMYYHSYAAMVALWEGKPWESGSQLLWERWIGDNGGGHFSTPGVRQYSMPEVVKNAIGDWGNLYLEMYSYYGSILLQGPVPAPTFRFHWVELEVPNPEGSVQIELQTTQVSIATWNPELTTTSTIPEPGRIRFFTHRADVTPANPIADTAMLITHKLPFVRSLGIQDKTVDINWPSVADARAVDFNESAIYVATATTVVQIDPVTRATIGGWPTHNRDVYTMKLSPDGEMLALGLRRYTDSDGYTSTTVPGLKLINTVSKTVISGFPAIDSAVHDVSFSEDGTKLALACSSAPYLRVLDVVNKTLLPYPDVDNFVTSVEFKQGKLFVTHRGHPRLTVINPDYLVDTGWPETPLAEPTDISFSPSGDRFTVSYKDRFYLVNTTQKLIDTNFTSLRTFSYLMRNINWLDSNRVLLGGFQHTDDARAVVFRVDNKTIETGWPAMEGNALSVSVGGNLVEEQADIVVEPDTASLQLAGLDALVEQVQEIEVSAAAELSFLTYEIDETIASSLTIDVDNAASLSIVAHDAAVSPSDSTQVVGNYGIIDLVAYLPNVTAIRSTFKLIDPDTTSMTARDADELSLVDLGSGMPGDERTISFRIGNTQDTNIDVVLTIRGSNPDMVNALTLSLDEETWVSTMTIRIKPNGLSPIIHMKASIPQDIPFGANTALLNTDIGVGT